MAFHKSESNAASVAQFPSNRSGGANDNWKSDAFINVYLPTVDGGKRKVGAIPLKLSRSNEASLIEYLQGGEGNIENFRNKLIVEFNMADANEGKAFDL